MNLFQCFLQFFGFLVQTLPIALLLIVPFYKETLIFSYKKSVVLISASTALFSAGFAVLNWVFATFFYSIYKNANYMMGNLYMLGYLIFITIFFFSLVRAPFIQKLTVLISLIHYSAILFVLDNILLILFRIDLSVSELYGEFTVLFYLFLMLLTVPLVYLFMKIKMRYSLAYAEDNMLRRGCIYLILALLLYCLCLFSIRSFESNFTFADASILLLLFSFIGTDVILYLMLFSEINLTVRNAQLTEQLRSFDEQYRKINDSITKARIARHDIHHHLNMIRMLHQKESQQELTDYLDSYEAVYQELEEMPLCNYPALDNILRYYVEYAKSQHIEVKTSLHALSESLAIDVIDLTVILANLMENAIEACRLIPAGEEKYIHIWIGRTECSLLFQIENSCPASKTDFPEFLENPPFLSRKDSSLHGQGLKSIRFAAEKYGGSAEFKRFNGQFTSRVVLNLP